MLDGRRIFLWIVPAIAGGSWALTDADGGQYALEIEQRFQEVTGTLTGGGRVLELQEAVLRGTALRFTAGGRALCRHGRRRRDRRRGGWRARRLA